MPASVPEHGSSPPRRPRYELLRVVNRGGMGEIALAKAIGTKGFEKLVVLKRLRADAEREDHLAMFDVEQEVMSRIEHPNIVKVFDQPVVDGVPYMAMEYVRGRNLDQIIRAANSVGEALHVQYCLTVIAEVLRGLAFVHRLKDADGRALGVVHQDMTPSNVMVSFFGEVKITDFGISYVTSRDGGLRRGVLKGKPRYVAPEVLAGKRVNNTADIYGVGVVLYEMLTGRALFARPSVKETLSAVAKNELPKLGEELAAYGPSLVPLVERALKKAPQERYRTAEEMAAHVLNELAQFGGPMPPASLGFLTRKYFQRDPDVPEMDPELERAISHGSANQPELQPKDLESTLQELDKLLGKDDSIDLFSVPDDLMPHLSEMPDMDPFEAHTPLPDFVWDAESEAEILAKAGVSLTPKGIERLFNDGEPAAAGQIPPFDGKMNGPQTAPPLAAPRTPDRPPGLVGPDSRGAAPAPITSPTSQAQVFPDVPSRHAAPRGAPTSRAAPLTDASTAAPTTGGAAALAAAHALTPTHEAAAMSSTDAFGVDTHPTTEIADEVQRRVWAGFAYGVVVGLIAGIVVGVTAYVLALG